MSEREGVRRDGVDVGRPRRRSVDLFRQEVHPRGLRRRIGGVGGGGLRCHSVNPMRL